MSCVINPTYFSMLILCFSQKYSVRDKHKKTNPYKIIYPFMQGFDCIYTIFVKSHLRPIYFMFVGCRGTPFLCRFMITD
nr:MAG TPA: hypothetical protein [Caudoviricetes sp.]